jgi:hypothetical protein
MAKDQKNIDSKKSQHDDYTETMWCCLGRSLTRTQQATFVFRGRGNTSGCSVKHRHTANTNALHVSGMRTPPS